MEMTKSHPVLVDSNVIIDIIQNDPKLLSNGSAHIPMRLVAIADDDSLVGKMESESADVLISLGDPWDVTIEKAVGKYGCPAGVLQNQKLL
jgi:hypothetical protein